MDKNHEGTTGLELGPISFVKQNEGTATKRDDNGRIRKRLAKYNGIGSRPHLFPRVVRGRDVGNENCGLNRLNPEEKRGPRENHSVRRHGSDAAKVVLGLVLLGRIRTNIRALDAPTVTLIHQGTAFILSDFIAYKDKGGKITANEFPKRPTNLCP
jgi:hypothetical protein